MTASSKQGLEMDFVQCPWSPLGVWVRLKCPRAVFGEAEPCWGHRTARAGLWPGAGLSDGGDRCATALSLCQHIQDRTGGFPAPGAACGVTALSPQTEYNQVTLQCCRGQGNTGNVTNSATENTSSESSRALSSRARIPSDQ